MVYTSCLRKNESLRYPANYTSPHKEYEAAQKHPKKAMLGKCRHTPPAAPKGKEGRIEIRSTHRRSPTKCPQHFHKSHSKTPTPKSPPPNKAAGPMECNPTRKKIVAPVFSQKFPETPNKTHFVEHVSADT